MAQFRNLFMERPSLFA